MRQNDLPQSNTCKQFKSVFNCYQYSSKISKVTAKYKRMSPKTVFDQPQSSPKSTPQAADAFG